MRQALSIVHVLISSKAAEDPLPQQADQRMAYLRISECLARHLGKRTRIARHLLRVLRAEILAVVSRHIVLDPEKVIGQDGQGQHVSTLEVDIEVPNHVKQSIAAAAR